MSWTYPTHIHATFLGLHLLLLTPPITAQQPPPWGDQTNKDYNSPMATALIVMIIVFFAVGFISIYLRHFLACLGLRLNSGPLPGRGGVGLDDWNREVPRGLDPTILNSFPTFLYSDVKVHRVGKTTPLECAICLSEFNDNEVLRLLPKCSHVFHPHCIGTWLASHVTCPVCRANLRIQVNNNQRLLHEEISEDESEPSDQIPHGRDDHRDVIVRIEASPDTQEMIKGLSESGRMRLHRSHSTGHSLVEDKCERFTLRLPMEVRNKLVNINPLSGLPAAIVSPRVGYRALSVNSATLPVKPDRWRFSMSPPFISRPGSPKLEGGNKNRSNGNNNMSTVLLRSPGSLFKSMKSPNKSPLNHVTSCNDIGERSSDQLWANRGPQELEIEDH